MNLNKKIMKPKIGLLKLAKSYPSARKAMGYSRDSYYRFSELYETGGEEALLYFLQFWRDMIKTI